jgi:uncharacterized protein (TIGR04255 family)
MGDDKTEEPRRQLRRPLKTPLFEVSAEVHFALEPVVEFPARSFYELMQGQYPAVQRVPTFLVADPTQLAAQNLHMPAYRFFDEAGSRVVQVGPRMVSLNTLTWQPGYEDYRAAALDVIAKYAELNPKTPVIRYALGFYNRIPAADLSEALEIINVPMPIAKNTSFKEFFWQVAQSTDAGSVLSQVATMNPDDRTPESYIAINNIVRFDLSVVQEFSNTIKGWVEWLDAAHDIAKNTLWNQLTETAQQSWQENRD